MRIAARGDKACVVSNHSTTCKSLKRYPCLFYFIVLTLQRFPRVACCLYYLCLGNNRANSAAAYECDLVIVHDAAHSPTPDWNLMLEVVPYLLLCCQESHPSTDWVGSLQSLTASHDSPVLYSSAQELHPNTDIHTHSPRGSILQLVTPAKVDLLLCIH